MYQQLVQSSGASLEIWNIPVHRDDLRVQGEWRRILLVLLPNSLAIRRSLYGESDADNNSDEQRKKRQDAVGDKGGLAAALMLDERID